MIKKLQPVIILILGMIIAFIAAQDFQDMHREEVLIPSDNLTEVKSLSDYFEKLQGSPVDTEIYFFEGEEEGATSLILGGTHPSEPAGYLSSVVFLENLKVNKGRVIIIPRSNPSAFSNTEPQEAHPQRFSFTLEDGSEREFRYGSRITNPIHQWPDPDVYVHPSGQTLSGSETRNLNRSYPGRPDGNLTEQLAYGILSLVQEENVDITFDLHEASPEYPVINAIVSHEKGMNLASLVVMDLQMNDLNISLEPSPKRLRGLTHRELGDYTETLPFLMETPNPIQGRLRGETNEELIITGYDDFYHRASELGLLYVSYDEDGWPIERRVGRHVATIKQFYLSFNELNPGNEIYIDNIPTFQELTEEGVARFLNSTEE